MSADGIVCPHCGEDLKRGARFCPECGSDATTGWASDADQAASYAESFTDEDYDDFLAGEGLGKRPVKKGMDAIYVIAAFLVVAALLLAYVL